MFFEDYNDNFDYMYCIGYVNLSKFYNTTLKYQYFTKAVCNLKVALYF